MKGFIVNIVEIIGVIILFVGVILHLYRVAKGEEWGEKIVVACLMIGFFLFVGSGLIEMSNRTCPSCEAYYKADAKFCSECGASLVTICPSCGAEWDSDFCGDCGAPMEQEG